jgi:hypothetical protein
LGFGFGVKSAKANALLGLEIIQVEKRISHCAAYDRTMSSFGRNDGSLWEEEKATATAL